MPSFTVKDLPPDVHQALKAEAAAHGRSLTGDRNSGTFSRRWSGREG